MGIPIVLYMARVCIIQDMSTVPVERFFSSLNQFLSDPDRMSSGYEYLEDMLRCHQNGPPIDEFRAADFIHAWQVTFKHKHVRSRFTAKQQDPAKVAKKKEQNAARYKRKQEEVKKKMGDRYSELEESKAASLGSHAAVVRPSLNAKELRAVFPDLGRISQPPEPVVEMEVEEDPDEDGVEKEEVLEASDSATESDKEVTRLSKKRKSKSSKAKTSSKARTTNKKRRGKGSKP